MASFRWKLRHQVPSWLLKGASSSPLDAKLFYTEHDISKRYYDIIINYKHIVFKHDFPGNLLLAAVAILVLAINMVCPLGCPKKQKCVFWYATKPSGFHRLDEPPEKKSAL